MAGLRARVQGTLALLGAAAITATQLITTPFTVATLLISVLSLLAGGGYVLWRGDRLSDLGFLGFILAGQAATLVYLPALQATGAGDVTVLALLSPTILAAVFCARRWHVIAQLALVSAEGSWLSVMRPGPTSGATTVVIGTVFTFVTVAVVVRLLRDLAHGALQSANTALETAREALTKAELGEVTDPLTGLANRRGLERRGGNWWLNQAARQQPLALLIVDIDHFKRVNDTRGHAAGDELIRQVAAILTSSVRRDDVVVRLGGEEFLMLGPDTAAEALVRAERVRRRIEQELRPITVSIGVFEAVPLTSDDLPASLWRAVDTADQALYEAKRSGRNRVVTAV
jgi:diguanylate cyclase (GGDEF)-like protein